MCSATVVLEECVVLLVQWCFRFTVETAKNVFVITSFYGGRGVFYCLITYIRKKGVWITYIKGNFVIKINAGLEIGSTDLRKVFFWLIYLYSNFNLQF